MAYAKIAGRHFGGISRGLCSRLNDCGTGADDAVGGVLNGDTAVLVLNDGRIARVTEHQTEWFPLSDVSFAGADIRSSSNDAALLDAWSFQITRAGFLERVWAATELGEIDPSVAALAARVAPIAEEFRGLRRRLLNLLSEASVAAAAGDIAAEEAALHSCAASIVSPFGADARAWLSAMVNAGIEAGVFRRGARRIGCVGGALFLSDRIVFPNGIAKVIDGDVEVIADSSGNINRTTRPTLSGILAGGLVVGWAFQKQRVHDDRTLVLVIAHPEWSWSAELQPDELRVATVVAAAVNSVAKSLQVGNEASNHLRRPPPQLMA
jgi:hypothetical protein